MYGIELLIMTLLCWHKIYMMSIVKILSVFGVFIRFKIAFRAMRLF